MKNTNNKKQYSPYFKGWYFKFQTMQGNSIALIPAFHINSHGHQTTSLQVITDKKSWCFEYPYAKSQFSEDPLKIHIAQTIFTEQGVFLNINKDNFSLSGTLHWSAFSPLQSNIMGPFRFFKKMECSHGVISMGHPLSGSVTLNGEQIDFSGGIGYVETDCGHSFPSAYLWTQCAWKPPQPNSIILSIATIPFRPIKFTGCICAIIYQGKEYRLATYQGAKIKYWSSTGAMLQQRNLRFSAELLDTSAQPLRAPISGSMSRTIQESLEAKLRYRFWVDNHLLFEHIDEHASFEYSNSQCNH